MTDPIPTNSPVSSVVRWGIFCKDAENTGLTDAGSPAGVALIKKEIASAVEATRVVLHDRPGTLAATVEVGEDKHDVIVGDWNGLFDLQAQVGLAWQRVNRNAAVANAIGNKAEVAPLAKQVSDFLNG
jgi:hypothetical protein